MRRHPGIDLASRPHPTTTYAEASNRIAALQHDDDDTVEPICGTQWLSHGYRTKRVIVLFHGYTNCPQQWVRFGQALFATGDNVLIPRMPYHGSSDRMTTGIQHLTANDLIHLTDAAIDCACGLGDEVIVAGISAGGVLAAWAAQFRDEVTHAVLVSPSLSGPGIPMLLSRAVTAMLVRMPNQWWWWDPRRKDRSHTPPHGYPRFSSRALGQIYRLGDVVLDAAQHYSPATRSVMLVNNQADRAINVSLVRRLVAAWQAHGLPISTSYTFPAALHLPHDMIDPAERGAQIDTVYPILLDMINRKHPTSVFKDWRM